MKVFRIEEAAEQIGCSPSTLKKLEREGIFRPGRSRANHRIYLQEEIEQIEKILFHNKAAER